MNRKDFPIATWLMWLRLPLTALRYWMVWDHLPFRMATHFDVNWQPNGWMPRETSFYSRSAYAFFMLAVFTVATPSCCRIDRAAHCLLGLLGFFYFVIGFIYYANDKVLQYNLDGQTDRVSASF